MLIAFPLLLIPVIIYNLVAMVSLGGGVNGNAADTALRGPWFAIPMTSGGEWTVSLGDLIILVGLILLFFELIKATSSQREAIVNHALSMILFIVCMVEFLLFKSFATSTFFLLTVMTLLDVLAGFIVTVISARKDIDFTSLNN